MASELLREPGGAAHVESAAHLMTDYFGQLVSRAEDVGKLNAAILQLAVQGKLVAQDPDDEPASELLKRIQVKRKQLVEEKKIRKLKPLPKIKKEEFPFPLPAGWEWVRFGNVSFNRDGERIPLSRAIRKDRQGSYDYYGASGVIDKIDDYIFDKSLLLIGEDGANLINRSTPIAFMAHGKYWVNNHAHVLDSLDLDVLKYLEVFINAIDLKPYVTGTAQPKMNQAKMNSILVALPPPSEQKRIVERVDSLLAQTRQLETELAEAEQSLSSLHHAATQELLAASDADEFAATWQFIADNFDTLYDEAYPEAALANVAALKQAILQLAVQGKLTRQDPADEPASALLTRIAAEKERLVKEKKIRKSKPLPEIGDEERPFVLPDGWEWQLTGNVAFVTKLAGFEYTKHINLQDQGEIPVIRAQNVRKGYLDETNLRYIDSKTSYQLERSALAKKALLMTFIGAGIGDVAIFEKDHRYHLAPNVAKIELFNNYAQNITEEYFLYFLMSPTGRFEIFKSSKATAQPSLSMKTIREVNVALPPLAEQKRIVTRVNSLLHLCDELSAHIQEAQATRVALRDAVLVDAS